MIYDSLKKDLYYKYAQILEKERKILQKNKNILKEKNDYDEDLRNFLSKIPKGFTYRSVDEYKELIEKIFKDLKNQYLFSLDVEDRKIIIQQIESILSEIEEIKNKESTQNTHQDDLKLKVLANAVLKKATGLFGVVRHKVLEKIKAERAGQFPPEKKTKKEKSFSNKEPQRNKKRKRGIEDLIKKIQKISKDDEESVIDDGELSDTSDQSTEKESPKEKPVNIQSLEQFLIDNQKDLVPELFDAALLAIQNAKKNPTPENIVQAKHAIQKALDET